MSRLFLQLNFANLDFIQWFRVPFLSRKQSAKGDIKCRLLCTLSHLLMSSFINVLCPERIVFLSLRHIMSFNLDVIYRLSWRSLTNPSLLFGIRFKRKAVTTVDFIMEEFTSFPFIYLNHSVALRHRLGCL